MMCLPHCYIQAFSGTQNVSSLQKDEAWRVNVRIQGCDLDHGYLCGTMEALNVPMADTPVRTINSSSGIFCFSLHGEKTENCVTKYSSWYPIELLCNFELSSSI